MKPVFFLMIITMMASCSVYVPNVVNTPLMNRKGEGTIAAHLGNGGHLQASYALTNHIGFMTNLMAVVDKFEDEKESRKGTGSLYEVGIGYFSGSFSSNAIFELYGGAGFGQVGIDKTFTANNITKKFDANALRYFVQPSIGGRWNIFEAAFSARLAAVQYSSISTTYAESELKSDHLWDLDKTTWMFVEPALTVRAGLKNIKVQAQIGKSLKITSKDLNYSNGFLNAGLIFRL